LLIVPGLHHFCTLALGSVDVFALSASCPHISLWLLVRDIPLILDLTSCHTVAYVKKDEKTAGVRSN